MEIKHSGKAGSRSILSETEWKKNNVKTAKRKNAI